MTKNLLIIVALACAGHFFMFSANWCLNKSYESDRKDGLFHMYLGMAYFLNCIFATFCLVGCVLLIGFSAWSLA